MPDSLETVASRIARLAMRDVPGLGKVGPGPVLSVVRDTETGEIFVGLNTGTPSNVADVLQHSINAQRDRIAGKQVVVVRTDPMAREGGHSEVCALNGAIRAREARLRRKMTETELRVFELHNVWLKGDRAGAAAARCEHCARITRSVSVTQSLFVAEGGRMGVTTAPQRGMIKRAGALEPEHVTTVSGSISPRRGGFSGGGEGGESEGEGAFMAEGLLSAALVLAEPIIKNWLYKKYLKDKFEKEAHDKLWAAINAHLDRYNLLISARRADILWAKADNRPVSLHICVETEWTATDWGDVLTNAEASNYDLLFEGEKHVEWPVFQKNPWWLQLVGPKITNSRECFNFAL
jgi:hypothetical protein